MKKIGVLILFILLINLFTFVSSQDVVNPEDPLGIGLSPDEISDPNALGQAAQNKSSYLLQEWAKILKQNPVIMAIHSAFTKGSIVFSILFGEPYTPTFGLLFVILLWLLFMIIVNNLIESKFGSKGGIGLLIAIGLAIIFAQIRFFRAIVNIANKVLEATDKWWVESIIWVVIIALILGFYYLNNNILGPYLEEQRKMEKEAETEHRQKKIEKFTKGAELE